MIALINIISLSFMYTLYLNRVTLSLYLCPLHTRVLKDYAIQGRLNNFEGPVLILEIGPLIKAARKKQFFYVN
jgi:hypothetical protein